MELIPYKSFAGISFDATEAEVVARLGPPLTREVSGDKTELHYNQLVVRVYAANGVQEFSALPPSVLIEGVTVLRQDLPKFLPARDPNAYEHVGFVISDLLGLMVDIDHDDHWLTAFTRERAEKVLGKTVIL